MSEEAKRLPPPPLRPDDAAQTAMRVPAERVLDQQASSGSEVISWPRLPSLRLPPPLQLVSDGRDGRLALPPSPPELAAGSLQPLANEVPSPTIPAWPSQGVQAAALPRPPLSAPEVAALPTPPPPPESQPASPAAEATAHDVPPAPATPLAREALADTREPEPSGDEPLLSHSTSGRDRYYERNVFPRVARGDLVFNGWAFFFGTFWLPYKGLWTVWGAIYGVAAAFSIWLQGATYALALLWFSAALASGLLGNRLYYQRYRRELRLTTPPGQGILGHGIAGVFGFAALLCVTHVIALIAFDKRNATRKGPKADYSAADEIRRSVRHTPRAAEAPSQAMHPGKPSKSAPAERSAARTSKPSPMQRKLGAKVPPPHSKRFQDRKASEAASKATKANKSRSSTRKRAKHHGPGSPSLESKPKAKWAPAKP